MTLSTSPSANEKNLPEKSQPEDLNRFVAEVYTELKRLAAYHLQNERPNHTLRPTELVHEVYLILRKQHSLKPQDRTHFISFASTIMRRVLVNYAIRRKRKKRGEGKSDVGVEEIEQPTIIEFEQNQVDIIALEGALNKLAERDVRQVKIVEMHFFGGLTFEEIADVLGLSSRTVMREWRFARTWLYSRLNSNR